MENIFLCYPKCTTCQKAENWLIEHNIPYTKRHIVEQNPTAEEITAWWQKTNLPLKRFFNTSGLMYKDMNLKERLQEMSDKEQIELLSTHGMLVKRPLLITDEAILVGFKENDWKEILL